jgi:hypothetical protein
MEGRGSEGGSMRRRRRRCSCPTSERSGRAGSGGGGGDCGVCVCEWVRDGRVGSGLHNKTPLALQLPN